MFRTEAVHVVLLAFFPRSSKFLDMVSFFSSFYIIYYTAHPFKPACSKLYSFFTLFTLCTFVVTKK